MDISLYLFYAFAAILVYAGVRVITSRNPVSAVLHLVLAFFTAGCIWMLLQAEFLAIAIILIYVGAVMVLFLFVIMMLDLGGAEDARRPTLTHCLPALLLAGITLGSLCLLVTTRSAAIATMPHAVTVAEFGVALFGRYGVAIELISMQLLFAVVGALYLGGRRKR